MCKWRRQSFPYNVASTICRNVNILSGWYSSDEIAQEWIELGSLYIPLIGITLLHGGSRSDGHTNSFKVTARFECID